MKKEIRTLDSKNKIIQITTVDERWYIKDILDDKECVIDKLCVPSVTWICSYYPKGISFYKWLAQKGWDEAESIKEAAGDKGSKVHIGIDMLIKGETININSKILNEEVTLEEYECLMSFSDWFKVTKPEILRHEFVVFGDNEAGTVDLECIINDEFWIVDFKTSQNVWVSHKLQVSAYKHIVQKQRVRSYKTGILQLGYKRNKKKYLFTEVEDCYSEFEACRTIWGKETKNIEPKQKDYPIKLSLGIKKGV